VIEHFTNEIKYKWQFEKLCDDNPKTDEEFKRTVQKMIAFEESTHERFPHSPQDNRGYDPRGNQGGQSSRKRGPDNTLASMDKSKKSNKNNKKFEDLKNLSRPFHKGAKHTAGECRQLQELGWYGKNKGKGQGKDNNDKDGDSNPDLGFQRSKGQIAVIFARVPSSSHKRTKKLALWDIMVGEPSTLKYLNWFEYLIQFSKKDQWTSVANVGHYPLVLGPTIASITVPKVLTDGGTGLNIIFAATLKNIGLDFTSLFTPTDVPFYRIVPGKAAMRLG
jgi:hypothetical protein